MKRALRGTIYICVVEENTLEKTSRILIEPRSREVPAGALGSTPARKDSAVAVQSALSTACIDFGTIKLCKFCKTKQRIESALRAQLQRCRPLTDES